MKLLLLVLAVIIARTAADNVCNSVLFNAKFYHVDIVKEGINKVHQIAYSRNEDTLYFTFDQLSKVSTRSLGYIHFGTGKVGIIDGIRNATGLAIDYNNNRVYVGGSDGLFFLNEVHKVPERLPVTEDIRYLFFKDVLYFVNNRRQALKFDSGVVYRVEELKFVDVDKLVIDDDNNILYLTKNLLFRIKLGTKAINTHEMYVVSAIAVDNIYKPYVCAQNGVYVYNKYKYALDKVAERMSGIKALTFDKSNYPIYVVNDKIIRLQYIPAPCYGDVNDMIIYS